MNDIEAACLTLIFYLVLLFIGPYFCLKKIEPADITDPEAVKKLIKKHISINTSDNYGKTALMYAAERGQIDVVAALINEGALLNSADNYGDTALINAVKNGHIDIVRVLLEYNADVNLANNKCCTPLICATKEGYSDISKLLIEHGANIDAVDTYHKNALDYARKNGNANIVRILISTRKSINERDKNGKTTLMLAAEMGLVDVINEIIEQHVNINAADRNGNTALMNAAENGRIDAMIALINAGADVNVKTKRGLTALMKASLNAASILIENGANINAVDNEGKTALIKATQKWGTVPILKKLIEAGADVNAVDNEGKTALINAAWRGELSNVKMLIEAGADANFTDKFGKTALDYALEKKDKIGRVRYNHAYFSNISQKDYDDIINFLRNLTNSSVHTATYRSTSTSEAVIVRKAENNSNSGQNIPTSDVSSQDSIGADIFHLLNSRFSKIRSKNILTKRDLANLSRIERASLTLSTSHFSSTDMNKMFSNLHDSVSHLMTEARSKEVNQKTTPSINEKISIPSKVTKQKSLTQPIQETPVELKLDFDRIRQIERDTSIIQEELGDIFKDDDIENEHLPSDDKAFQNKDRNILLIGKFIQKEKWTVSEAKELCAEFDCMLSSAIDRINEWTDEKLGDYLLEQEDEFVIIDESLAQKFKEEFL